MSKLSKVETEDDAEQGSSEENLEGVSNVGTKPFSRIASCQLLKQNLSDNAWGRIETTGICLLPDGHVVVCQKRHN